MLVLSTVDARSAGLEISETREYKEALTKARLTADSLLRQYKQALLSQGGIKQAFLAECVELWQGIAVEYSSKTGYIVRRTSLKYRNPINKPTPDEKRVLKDLNRLYKKGELKAGHENHSIVEKSKVKYLLYIRPLITNRMCLNCHGTSSDITPEIGRIIKKLYPKDKAVGHEVGDIRGAVSIMYNDTYGRERLRRTNQTDIPETGRYNK